MNELDYEDILAYFNNFDSKKNGELDFSEFADLVKSIGFNIGHEQLKEGFNKIDTDNNNAIDLEEFMAWWGEHK
jgi:Ca2+-binding EF-hand superfamily protein